MLVLHAALHPPESVSLFVANYIRVFYLRLHLDRGVTVACRRGRYLFLRMDNRDKDNEAPTIQTYNVDASTWSSHMSLWDHRAEYESVLVSLSHEPPTRHHANSGSCFCQRVLSMAPIVERVQPRVDRTLTGLFC